MFGSFLTLKAFYIYKKSHWTKQYFLLSFMIKNFTPLWTKTVNVSCYLVPKMCFTVWVVTFKCPMACFYITTFQPPPLTTVQWAEFLPKVIFLPYLLIGEFTWDWMDIHYWTSRFILATCITKTILEANYVAMCLRREQP